MNKAKWQKGVRKWHRRLGVVIGIQLLLWTISGVYFAWFHIDNVHGDYERNFAETPGLEKLEGMLPMDVFLKKSGLEKIEDMQVGWFLERIVVRLYRDGEKKKGKVEMYDAFSGELLSPITEEQAKRLAKGDFTLDSKIISVERVTKKEGEYKGMVPVYRVSFDNSKNTNVYVHADSGVVTARRN
ncbi:MAG: hypothetical protein GY940_25770, partial [bacterium]|nr:hypothetical protein [bacterium]